MDRRNLCVGVPVMIAAALTGITLAHARDPNIAVGVNALSPKGVNAQTTSGWLVIVQPTEAKPSQSFLKSECQTIGERPCPGQSDEQRR